MTEMPTPRAERYFSSMQGLDVPMVRYGEPNESTVTFIDSTPVGVGAREDERLQSRTRMSGVLSEEVVRHQVFV